MPATSLEQYFVRYRDHGDLPALATVFDALAGHLLLVAGHLVRDGALAEDLVQTTFVEAMRSAARYDVERPLLPWLVRILTHQARKLHRQRSRPDEPRPQQRQVHASAATHALDREVVAVVEHALAALPPRYRQVLTLRLVHDLSPTAIAHALGCPPNTVKTRLKRGLELLRRHLPSGIATMVALTLATGRGLAAVRADVMLQAGRTTRRVAKAAAWGAFPVGVLLMNHFLLRVGLVVLVLVLAGFGVDAWTTRLAAPEKPASGAGLAAAAIEPTVGSEAQPVRIEVRPPVVPAKAIVFRGRCLDAITGKPLPGVAAAAWWIRPESSRLVCEDDLADALDHTLTDAAGQFRLACDLTETLLLRVSVGGEGLRRRLGGFGPFEGPQDVDCGDLLMHAGVRVTTRVVDQRGQPVGGVAVAVRCPTVSTPGDEPLLERNGDIVRTAADGTVPWRSALAPGPYEVEWYEDSIPPQRKFASMVVPEGISTLANELLWPVEDERHAIRGIAIDEQGRPVAGLELYAEGGGTRGHGNCATDGSFVIPRIGPYDEAASGPVAITISNALPGYELVDGASCSWGSQDVRLVARTQQALIVRVIDSRTNAAQREFWINCAALPPEYDTPVILLPRLAPLGDGAVQLGISRLPHLVQVLPKDPALAPSAIVRWEPGTTNELTVTLSPAKTIEVVLITEAGEPVAGSEVWSMQLMEEAPGEPVAGLRDVPLPNALAWGHHPEQRWKTRGYGVDDTPLARGFTDAAGRVRLRAPTDRPVMLVASGPGHVPRTVVTAPDDHLELRVQRGAAVKFELFPPELLPLFLPSVRDQQYAANKETGGTRQVTVLAATRVQAEQDPEHWDPTHSTNVAGSSCLCDGLQPGTQDLSLYGVLRFGEARIGLFEHLATVRLQAGEVRVVPVDLRRWAPGRVEGQVLINGSPWAFGSGSLERSPLMSVAIATDSQGRFVTSMVCGESRLHLTARGDHSAFWCAPEKVAVTAGTTTRVVLQVRRVAARVQVLTAAGQPAVNWNLRMACPSEPDDRRVWKTDAKGCTTIDPAPLAEFHLIATTGEAVDKDPVGTEDPDVKLGPMQVPPVDTAAEFHLHLPR